MMNLLFRISVSERVSNRPGHVILPNEASLRHTDSKHLQIFCFESVFRSAYQTGQVTWFYQTKLRNVTRIRNICKSFVSNQCFGARIKPARSRDFTKRSFVTSHGFETFRNSDGSPLGGVDLKVNPWTTSGCPVNHEISRNFTIKIKNSGPDVVD